MPEYSRETFEAAPQEPDIPADDQALAETIKRTNELIEKVEDDAADGKRVRAFLRMYQILLTPSSYRVIANRDRADRIVEQMANSKPMLLDRARREAATENDEFDRRAERVKKAREAFNDATTELETAVRDFEEVRVRLNQKEAA